MSLISFFLNKTAKHRLQNEIRTSIKKKIWTVQEQKKKNVLFYQQKCSFSKNKNKVYTSVEFVREIRLPDNFLCHFNLLNSKTDPLQEKERKKKKKEETNGLFPRTRSCGSSFSTREKTRIHEVRFIKKRPFTNSSHWPTKNWRGSEKCTFVLK